MRGIDLTKGGWQGWHFGPWGRAKEWRLHAPEGTSYTCGEIDYLRRIEPDYHYLQGRVRELEAKLDKNPLLVSDEEIQTLHAAAAILDRTLRVFAENQARKIRHEKANQFNDHLVAFLNARRVQHARSGGSG